MRSKPPKPSPPKVKVDLDDPRFPNSQPSTKVVVREKTPQITRYLQPSPRASVVTDRSSKASSEFKTVDFKLNELAVPHKKNVVNHQVDSNASLGNVFLLLHKQSLFFVYICTLTLFFKVDYQFNK